MLLPFVASRIEPLSSIPLTSANGMMASLLTAQQNVSNGRARHLRRNPEGEKALTDKRKAMIAQFHAVVYLSPE